ncbi:hypothetical protein IFM89_014409 [Coptis chinensis]|uniref:RNA cytidine acetyltransferase n=1 Tax=Coptis chinensis TaxID=261450 RepID=A0A835HYD7_9MAGN|nr:hypothetical protein IFM89_014409 [Coptis chinensis]
MVNIKVDPRITDLIKNGVEKRHRSMFVIIGDKSRDQIVNLHHLLTKAMMKSRPSILWCYKNKLDISSHRKKRGKQMKKMMRNGLLEQEKADPFLLFVESGGLTYCMYKDSERVLGNTFGMCILQDFEALTPNLLARTIETVEGGGLIVLLLRSLTSLTSLYTMAMDVHERFRTESHSDTTGRFNERFLLSIASCKTCVVMDDELHISPISVHVRETKEKGAEQGLSLSSHNRSDETENVTEDFEGLSESQRDLKNLKEQLNDDFPVGPLIKKCCTLDQGKAIVVFLDAILDKTLRNTVALLAARGRGKSAALGLSIAGAIAAGYSNIFVTAPSPENLKTLFEFVIKGLDALEYKYIQPHEHEKLSQVELLVVDEAAAIPLPVVKSLFGPYLIFLSSTVNGYEGTGRSLSLKLLQQLEEQSRAPNQMQNMPVDGPLSGRIFKKVELSESIRYASGDPIESWLHGLLCLDVTSSIPPIRRLPDRNECDLYYVNRDTLFSYHKESEIFLQRMMALYVASHYKNSPNDLQLMADAPAHQLFVLLGPVDESKNNLPDILCVIQVCLEGRISSKSASKSLSEGHQPHGDQIPWKFCEQFQDTVFPTLSGARIVRIAVHPSAMRLGYGSTAVELLTRYYEGQLTPITEMDVEEVMERPPVRVTEAVEKGSLLKETIKPRAGLPPLLVHLRERRPEKLHYIGVSFGLTLDLFRFWGKHKFSPFYIGQIQSAVTGEHTCMDIKPLNNDDVEVKKSEHWGFFTPFYQDFRNRFLGLLGSSFRAMEYKLCMSILDPRIDFREPEPTTLSSGYLTSLSGIVSPHDMKRLRTYTDNLADFHLILDLVPTLAHHYFRERLPITLSYTQASILLCMGLKNQDITCIEREMKLERQQILSQFIKVMKKLHKYLDCIASNEIESTLPQPRERLMTPHSVSVDDDLNDAAKKIKEKMKAESDGSLDQELQKYAIAEEIVFEQALPNGGPIPSSGLISVKGKLKENQKSKEKKKRDDGSSRSSKKKKH